VHNVLGVVYGRLPGEAWDLGAGYVVGRNVLAIDSPFAFFGAADDKDKKSANVIIVGGVVLAAMLLGLFFTFMEHSRPLQVFRGEAQRLAKGESEALVPSKFRGIYRTIASDLNDGLDKAIGKGGGTRRAADLEKVLGDLPAEPQMSAFSFPGDAPAASPSAPRASAPSNPRPDRDSGGGSLDGDKPKRPPPPPPRMTLGQTGSGNPPPPPPPPSPSSGGSGSDEPTEEWKQVFDDFAATKEKCGESLDGFTFEKFQSTLRKHRDVIMERQGAKRVKFSVYVKDGKAALKASPVKD
jgi:hypothetical protein